MSTCTQMRRAPLGIAVGVPLDLVCQAPIRGQVSAAHDDISTGLSSSLGLYLAETLTLDHSPFGPETRLINLRRGRGRWRRG